MIRFGSSTGSLRKSASSSLCFYSLAPFHPFDPALQVRELHMTTMPTNRKRKQSDSEDSNVLPQNLLCARRGCVPKALVMTSCDHPHCPECIQEHSQLCKKCNPGGQYYVNKRLHEFEEPRRSKPTPAGSECETNGDLQRKPKKTPTLPPLASSSETGESAPDTLATEDADPDANPDHVETLLRDPAIPATTSAKDVPQPPSLATTKEPHITDGMRSQVLAMDIICKDLHRHIGNAQKAPSTAFKSPDNKINEIAASLSSTTDSAARTDLLRRLRRVSEEREKAIKAQQLKVNGLEWMARGIAESMAGVVRETRGKLGSATWDELAKLKEDTESLILRCDAQE